MGPELEPKKSFSRRDFLKGSVVAGLGGILTGCKPTVVSDSNATASAETPTEADPIPPVNPPASWDYEADIVVVGTGGGGLAAAKYAAEKGASVIAIEKNDVVGGATRHAMAFVNLTGGSKGQNEIQYAWPSYPLDVDAAVSKLKDGYNFSFNEKLMRNLIEVGGEATDWLMSQEGIHWGLLNPIAYADTDYITGKQAQCLGMNNTVNAIEAAAIKAGAHFMMLTKCETLVADNGKVVGIQISDNTGAKKYIKANKGVILCAGGFGMNQALTQKYLPSVWKRATQGGPMPFHTGEAFRMGLGVGADFTGFDSWSCWEGAPDDYFGDGDGQYWHYFWHGERQLCRNPWLKINILGERIPYYSRWGLGQEEQTLFKENIEMNCGDLPSVVEGMSTIGHRAYVIFDADYPTNIFKFKVANERVPIRSVAEGGEPLIPNSLCTDDWKAEVRQAIDRGVIKEADTIEELAVKLKLKPDAVVAAVNRWNEACANGVDNDDLTVPYLSEWLLPIQKAPFYGVATGGQLAKTCCGLRTDEYLQVMKPDGELIPGLYANYSTAGGLIGEGNYGGMMNPTIFASNAASWITGYFACKSLLAKA